ncbi:imidazolonepropionase [Marisediminicola antarctica]|uniref:Imidazolonepropionase n=1 Tax=Marisediminicola antarctica TaxID=674079 RepID=A0A7L5ANV7_9MICO|nr:imidazolonepropionase [Marisediminicola antarctica]
MLIENIGLLVTHDAERPERSGAAIVIENGRVAWVGDWTGAPDADERIDAGGRCAIPGFVDSHSHLVFGGDRAAEFEARMAGRRYEAGGIRSTVEATRAASDAQLLAGARRLLSEMRAQGTTTVEIKSGYGLTVADECRILSLARTLTAETTYLGAHVVPADYSGRRDDYVALVEGEMLDACAPHSRWIDVFIDDGAFTVDEARSILTAGIARGLGARVHAGQLGVSGGVRLAVELGAASVDHCTYLADADVEALAGSAGAGAMSRDAGGSAGAGAVSRDAGGTGAAADAAGVGAVWAGTVATLLPGVEFSTRSPYPDARRLLDAGVRVALASDCNPGSSYTSSMPFCIALAVREMGMTAAEAVRAATLGGAQALRRTDIGHLRVGAAADIVLLDAPSYVHLAYRPGVPLVHRVIASSTE